MPKVLEAKLKKEYGAKSDVPYKIMNKMGMMKGSKTTAKGKKYDMKHAMKSKKAEKAAEKMMFGGRASK